MPLGRRGADTWFIMQRPGPAEGAKEPRNAGLLSYGYAYITSLEMTPAGVLGRLTGGREAPDSGKVQPMSRPASV